MATEIDLQTDTSVAHHYQILRRRNFSHEDALRLAHGHLINVIGTDTQIMGTDDGFGNDNRSRQLFRKKCAAEGVPVTGKYYGQLCRKGMSLDPFAQASSVDEIKKKLQLLGRGAEGSINVKGRDADTDPKPYRVADSIVQREVRDTIINNKLRPSPKQRQEMTEIIRNDLTPAM